MSFQEPTYNEYKKANNFAKFRYKYGLVVTVFCWVCLILLLYFVFTYSKELITNPLIYGAKKYKVDCHCYNYSNAFRYVDFYVNSNSISIVRPENDPNSLLDS